MALAYQGKVKASIATCVILALAFVALLYNEIITSSVSSSAASVLRFNRNSSSPPSTSTSTSAAATPATATATACVNKSHEHDHHPVSTQKYTNKGYTEDLDFFNEEVDKLDHKFDPDSCDVTDGKWVFNRTAVEPLYSDSSCPYVDRQYSCATNGRPDSNYVHWKWQPDSCTLPDFNPKLAMRKLKDKRLMFVGDSLIRNQWESFVCMLDSVIHGGGKTMRQGKIHSVFKATKYNASIEFYWAPFLVESNSDVKIIGDPKQRILKVDSVAAHAKNWEDVDVLVFGTYVWWMSGLKIKAYWGTFANGEEGHDELSRPVAYRMGLKTWANWVDTTLNPNRTRVYFTTMSPTHTRSLDWGRNGEARCYNETGPVKTKGHWGTGSDKAMMKAASEVIQKMKYDVRVINVTQISEYRVDGHSSVYTEMGGELLTEEQRKMPEMYADCIHWCLPGVPDTWNRILLAIL